MRSGRTWEGDGGSLRFDPPFPRRASCLRCKRGHYVLHSDSTFVMNFDTTRVTHIIATVLHPTSKAFYTNSLYSTYSMVHPVDLQWGPCDEVVWCGITRKCRG